MSPVELELFEALDALLAEARAENFDDPVVAELVAIAADPRRTDTRRPPARKENR